MKNLAKVKKPVDDLPDILLSLKYFKGLESRRNNRWGWYKFKCWQFILNNWMDEPESEKLPKGIKMLQ